MGRLTGRSITIVGINYAPEATGIAPYTTALARSLSAAGASVHVVTGLPHYPQWSVDEKYTDGSYFREFDGDVRVTRCRHSVPSNPNLVGRSRMEVSFLARALRVVRKDRSDLVLTVTPSLAGMAAGVLGRRGRPVGTIVQDLTGNAACETGAAKAWVGSVIRWAENALLRRCRNVGVITTGFRDDVTSAGVDAAAVVDLPNFAHIEPVTVTTAFARRRLGWDPQKFTVLHTGNMGAKQGLLCVVESARLAEQQGLEVEFVLMGDGNQREALSAAAGGIGSIRILSPVSAREYPLVLEAADVLLVNELPGVRQMSLPSKLTSYAASGKPIVAAVASDGITADFLSSAQLGHVVESGRPQLLLDAVLAVRDDPDLRKSLEASSTRVFHTHYGKASAYERYVEFAALVAGRPAVEPVRLEVPAFVPASRVAEDNALELAS